MLKQLEYLFKLARERKIDPKEKSYTNQLLKDKSLIKNKVLEEVSELIKAVEEDTNKVHEAADVSGRCRVCWGCPMWGCWRPSC